MTKRLIAAFLCILLLIPAMALADAAPSKLGVKVIEAGAFSGDESLSTITFDEDLTYIGSRAFEGCKGLVTVYCFSDDVVIEEDAFDGVENALIYCDLDSTMEAYAQRKGLTVKYLNAFETECDTEDEDACVLLPITWRVKNAMPGRNVTSRFVYEVYRDDVSVYTSDSTSDTSFSYTPTEAGDYSVSITMSNSLTVTTLATGKVKVKDKLYMGSMDGEKIEWKVLTVSGNKALVISTKILKNASYFNPYWIKYKYTYWSGSYIGSISQNYRGSQPEDPSRLITGITPTHVPLADGSWGKESDLFKVHARYWCNETFYNGAFSSRERDRIVRVTNSNPDSPYGIKGGPDSKDYVFFLSYDELKKYMPNTADRKCTMTSAAKKEPNGNTTNCWWLRTQGKYRVNAMYVDGNNGRASEYGSDVGHKSVGYRPAMWIRIGS